MGGMSGRSEQKRGRNGRKIGTEREDGETGGQMHSFGAAISLGCFFFLFIVIRMESLTD